MHTGMADKGVHFVRFYRYTFTTACSKCQQKSLRSRNFLHFDENAPQILPDFVYLVLFYRYQWTDITAARCFVSKMEQI